MGIDVPFDPEEAGVEIHSTVGRRGDEPDVPEGHINMGRGKQEEPGPEATAPEIRVNMGRVERDQTESLTVEKRAEVERVLSRLGETDLGALVEKYGGYEKVLGGSIPETMLGGYHLNPKGRLDQPYDVKVHGQISPKNGFSRPWETGVSVNELIENSPKDRCKFYLSLDLSTPEKEARAQEFMKRVGEKAAETKISLLTKPEDHTYDSCNIYTWSPEQMAAIISELYEEFPDIWLDTEHPLQGRLGEVSPKHVGFVQEPIGGYAGGSHSARMGKLGQYIDEARATGSELSAEVFAAACRRAGVRHDAPWLIDPEWKPEQSGELL